MDQGREGLCQLRVWDELGECELLRAPTSLKGPCSGRTSLSPAQLQKARARKYSREALHTPSHVSSPTTSALYTASPLGHTAPPKLPRRPSLEPRREGSEALSCDCLFPLRLLTSSAVPPGLFLHSAFCSSAFLSILGHLSDSGASPPHMGTTVAPSSLISPQKPLWGQCKWFKSNTATLSKTLNQLWSPGFQSQCHN